MSTTQRADAGTPPGTNPPTPADPSAGKFALSLSGDIKPGNVFYVMARVTSPLKGQTLKLRLSTDTLERAEGAEAQPVPGP